MLVRASTDVSTYLDDLACVIIMLKKTTKYSTLIPNITCQTISMHMSNWYQNLT